MCHWICMCKYPYVKQGALCFLFNQNFQTNVLKTFTGVPKAYWNLFENPFQLHNYDKMLSALSE